MTTAETIDTTTIGSETEDQRRPSMLLEQRAPLELVSLFASPAYYGIGVPRGNGSPVLIVPGFLGSDRYLGILRDWLRRIVYQPYLSEVGIMAGPPRELAIHVLERAGEIARREGRRVTIVGHSLGGVVGLIAAKRRPDLIRHVIAMGSPLNRNPRGAANPRVRAMARVFLRSDDGAPNPSAQQLRSLLSEPLPAGVRLDSIYTQQDPIVDWRSCLYEGAGARSHEVHGSHIGLAWNPQVYRLLGTLLAESA